MPNNLRLRGVIIVQMYLQTKRKSVMHINIEFIDLLLIEFIQFDSLDLTLWQWYINLPS